MDTYIPSYTNFFYMLGAQFDQEMNIQESKMELMCFSAFLLGGLLALWVLLRKANEWFYVGGLGNAKKKLLPPGDMGLPFLGTTLSFLNAFKSHDPDSFISNFSNRYGATGIYRTYIFGRPCVIVTTPEVCKRVLSDDVAFGLGYPTSLTTLMGKKVYHGISYEERKRLRRLTTNPLSGQDALSLYINHIEDFLVASLERLAIMERPIEFLIETRKIALKVIIYVTMGERSDMIMDALEKEFTTLNLGFMSMGIDLPGFDYHKACKARRNLQRIFQSVVDERRMSVEVEKKDMMGMLMYVEDESGAKLSDEEIIDLIIMFLHAGHESSGHAIMWAIVLMHDHPNVLQKAMEEQEEIVRRRPSTQKGLTLKETRQMEYLSKVIDETFRIVNIAFALFREANTDVNINGYLVPKGWRILTWLRSAHLDQDKFLNAKDFNPSRWDDPKTRANYIPFGAGSRMCPGRDLARLEIYIFLHYFLLNYRLERVNPESPNRYLPIPWPIDNCLAQIRKIN